MCDLNVDNPVEEGNKVARIEAMPPCTDKNSINLSLSLLLFAFPFLRVVFGIIYVLVYVFSERPLHTNVPVVNFDFHGGVKVKFCHVVDFNSAKVILEDGAIRMFYVF